MCSRPLSSCVQLYDKTFLLKLTLSVCLCVPCVILSFCDDHEFIDVSRCVNSW